ncbi:acetyl-CoA C-acyltransferase, partial [Photobacterium damselae]
MERVFIVAAKRSAIGAFGGTLKDQAAGKIAAEVIKGALDAANINGAQ